MGKLEGKVAWITGAGSGIGEATAHAMAKEGAIVALTGRRKEPLDTVAHAIEKAGGKGVAAPSANRFGNVSPTTAQAVSEELSAYLVADDVVLDGGPSQVGVESTIIDCTSSSPRILRPGAITEEMVAAATGSQLSQSGTEIRVSGSLENHYAPNATVDLNRTPTAGEGFIALADIQTPANVIRLAAPNSVEDFARLMYAALREGDAQGLKSVVVTEPDGDGLALAIRDRLMRASKGR